MNIEHGKTYRLYGRMGKMRRMKPVCGDRFVTNLLYADLYTPMSDVDSANMIRELEFLATQGEFEYRLI